MGDCLRHVEAPDSYRIDDPGAQAEMDRAGLNVPKPITSQSGALLEDIDGQHVDLISWLDGRPIGQTLEPSELDDPVAIFTDTGAEMARFPKACNAWD